MKLQAMVSGSTFEDVVNDLTGDELRGMQYSKNYVSGDKTLLITAEATPERIMEIARQNAATVAKFDGLPTFDRLEVVGHSIAGGEFGPDRIGTICFWTKSEREKF